MILDIVSPEKIVFSGEVKLVQVPGSKSPIVMLDNHAPILSMLQEGTLRIVESNGRERHFEITGGIVENKHNKLVALVEMNNSKR
jgi:F-type H+-transporting ATPase subunit epsilon